MGNRAIKEKIPQSSFRRDRLTLSFYFTSGFQTLIVNSIFGQGRLRMGVNNPRTLTAYQNAKETKKIMLVAKNEIIFNYLQSLPNYLDNVSFGRVNEHESLMIIDDFDADLCDADRVKKYFEED